LIRSQGSIVRDCHHFWAYWGVNPLGCGTSWVGNGLLGELLKRLSLKTKNERIQELQTEKKKKWGL
jgi:hypothetical protein